MGVIGWIIIGGLAGWLASIVTGTNERFGWLANILIGIAGAFIGGLIFGYARGDAVFDFSFLSLLVAFAGAVILLLILRLFMGTRTARR
ncbi:MAG: GlsB/YeaQ/YmgE family stress response membrane protein [Candidatus Geothermincolia bacterium]